jgi:chaperone LolA
MSRFSPIVGLWLSALLLLLAAQSGICENAAQILQNLQNRYDTLSDLEVSFTQEVHSGVFASVERTSGKMFLASEDRFRVQTEQQVVVSDGELLWVYSRENRQVTIDKVAKSKDMVRPSDYLFSFRESYTSRLIADTVIGNIDCHVVRLDCAGADEFIQQMTLYVGKKDLLTHRASYVDINGNTVVMSFSDLKIDSGLPKETFVFETPKGVEEVRLP